MAEPSASDAVIAPARRSAARTGESPSRRALHRFTRHRAALVGLAILVVVAVMAIFAPLFSWHDPTLSNPSIRYTPPNADHILGTDGIGRDQWARLLYAGRVSLSVGLAEALFATAVGMAIGLVAGIFGGPVDAILMRVTDAFLAIPVLIAIAIVTGVVGTGAEIVVLVIGIVFWTEAARMVRSVVLSLREQDFVTAARAVGAGNGYIIRKHLLFHALGPLTVTGTFMVATALLTEAALSYLGIGVRPPQSSWGNMLYEAQQLFVLAGLPWYWVPPGLTIFAAVLAVNLVGDGLLDALDPHEYHR